MMKTFVAEVSRNGEFWILQVPAVDFLAVRAGNLLEAEDKLRAIVARRLGLVRSDVSFELQDANVARRLRQRLSPAPQAHPAIIL
jgi:hypothetical protein